MNAGMTPIGQLSATGTGEVRDADGNLLSPATPVDGGLLLNDLGTPTHLPEKDE